MFDKLEQALSAKYMQGAASFIVMSAATSLALIKEFLLLESADDLLSEASPIKNIKLTVCENLPVYISESLEYGEFKIG